MCIRIHSPKMSHVFINSLYICVCDQEQGEGRKNRRWKHTERQREGGGKKKSYDFSPPLCDTREEVAARENPSFLPLITFHQLSETALLRRFNGPSRLPTRSFSNNSFIGRNKGRAPLLAEEGRKMRFAWRRALGI